MPVYRMGNFWLIDFWSEEVSRPLQQIPNGPSPTQYIVLQYAMFPFPQPTNTRTDRYKSQTATILSSGFTHLPAPHTTNISSSLLLRRKVYLLVCDPRICKKDANNFSEWLKMMRACVFLTCKWRWNPWKVVNNARLRNLLAVITVRLTHIVIVRRTCERRECNLDEVSCIQCNRNLFFLVIIQR